MLNILVSGTLYSSQSRVSGKGNSYLTGSIRVPMKAGDKDMFISFIAFSDSVQGAISTLEPGEALSVSGPGELKSWTGKDGTEKHGISIIVDHVMTNMPAERERPAKGGKSVPPKAHGRQEETGGAAPTQPLSERSERDDDIPF